MMKGRGPPGVFSLDLASNGSRSRLRSRADAALAQTPFWKQAGFRVLDGQLPDQYHCSPPRRRSGGMDDESPSKKAGGGFFGMSGKTDSDAPNSKKKKKKAPTYVIEGDPFQPGGNYIP